MNAKEKNIFQSPCEIVSHFLAFWGLQFGLFVCFQSQGQVGWVGGSQAGQLENFLAGLVEKISDSLSPDADHPGSSFWLPWCSSECIDSKHLRKREEWCCTLEFRKLLSLAALLGINLRMHSSSSHTCLRSHSRQKRTPSFVY